METLSYNVPSKIALGSGVLSSVKARVNVQTNRLFVVTEEGLGASRRALESLSKQGYDAITYAGVTSAGRTEPVQKGAEFARVSKASAVVGIGGMKVLASAKAIAALAATEQHVDHLADGVSYDGTSLPLIQIPTVFRDPFLLTATALLNDSRTRKPTLFTFDRAPTAVIIDPELTQDLALKYQQAMLLDAFLTALEGYYSTKRNFISDTLLLKAVGIVLSAIGEAEAGTLEFRERACRAGLAAALGLTMTNPGLGTAVARGLNAYYGVPKSLAGAMMIPPMLEYGVRACPDRVARMAPILGEDLRALTAVSSAGRVAEEMRTILAELEIPTRLRDFGVDKEAAGNLADAIPGMPGIDTMPAPMAREDIVAILEDAM